MKLIKEFQTVQCVVKIYDTGLIVDFCRIYCIKSFHNKGGKVTTRFGTKAQIKSYVNTYNTEKRFTL